MRRSLSTTARVRIFEAAAGICHLCGTRIQVGQRWDVEHVIPLALGGADDDANMRPAHEACHDRKTAKEDQPAIARAKRRQAKHIGIKKPSTMPGSRSSRWKKKMDGTVVARDTRHGDAR